MNPTLAGLVRACKDEPFDDQLRLILADWLEENGDPARAELIRLQIALPENWDDPERTELLDRQGLLIRADAERWLGPARQWYRAATIERGFVYIEAQPQQLLDHPPSDLPTHILPWLEVLCLGYHDLGRAELLAAPFLALFSRFMWTGGWIWGSDGYVTNQEMERLLANPAVTGFRSLQLPGDPGDNQAGPLVAAADSLTGLRSLDFLGNNLGDAGATALAQAPWLPGITRLGLRHTRLSRTGLAALLDSPHLGALTHLRLNGDLDEAATQVLAGSPRLGTVTHLDLQQARFTTPALRVLAASPYLRPVHLDLTDAPLGASGATPLARGRLLERIKHLTLGKNNLTEKGSVRLLQSEHLAALESLTMHNPIGDGGCAVLASSDRFDRLRCLDLTEAGIGPTGAAALGRARYLGALASLNMCGNPLGTTGVANLTRRSGLPALEALYLSRTLPQARGLQALVASGLPDRLRRLDLSHNRLRPTAITALAGLPAGRLLELALNSNSLGPVGAKALAALPVLASLRRLDLGFANLRDQGLLALLRSPYLKQLTHLDLIYNDLTDVGGAALRDWPRRSELLDLSVSDDGLSQDLWRQINIRSPFVWPCP